MAAYSFREWLKDYLEFHPSISYYNNNDIDQILAELEKRLPKEKSEAVKNYLNSAGQPELTTEAEAYNQALSDVKKSLGLGKDEDN